MSHPIDQSQFYKVRSKKRLAKVLRVSPEALREIQRNIEYTSSQIEKSDGTFRTVYNPCPPLKKLQRRIGNLLSRIEMPSWTFFARKGVCYVDNAQYHEGAHYLVKSDIASFYDNCDREHVYRFFTQTMQCSPDIAKILSDLTTYRLSNGTTIIPTGSPSAQIIAFLAYQEMFKELKLIANRYGCRFSLYVDDLTFSSNSKISNPGNLERQINRVAKRYGHHIKAKKTMYLGANSTKIITGVALSPSGKLKVTNALRKATVTDLSSINRSDFSKTISCLGRISAAQMVEPTIFESSKRQIEQIFMLG